ncbi:MAG: SDR family NAD(P)-dependent oxidoreductase [Imperialibacter sp.]|uniref:SDR family NAD(P)-dependent oxidoreductase n=1 Tax=Imperialibacter sp. TaxID=2038411 RepID=UPI0032ED299D
MERFENQVAIVAGGARGIGKGVAKRLASEGATVVILDVLQKELDATVKELTGNGLKVSGEIVDVTSEKEIQTLVQQVVATNGRLDVMVNCAGIVGETNVKIGDYTTDIFDKVIAINLRGAFLLTKHAIAPMLKAGYGRILHVTSIGGKEGNPGMMGYAASKSGLIGLVKGAGKEYAESGITVNGIAPAVIATEFNENTDPAMLKYMTDKIPMKRMGTIEEVAALSCWIVSKEASFNTGFVFDISGGRATY